MDGCEETLIRRAQAGDIEAFDALFAPYLPVLTAYCRSLCADYQYAEDAVQETALVAFKNLNRFFPESDFSVWLKAIARRQALAASRRWRRLGRISARLVEESYHEEESESAEVSNLRLALSFCLKKLPERMAAVVRSHYFEGHGLTAVAEQLHMSLSNAKVIIFRARENLRRCTQQRLTSGDAE